MDHRVLRVALFAAVFIGFSVPVAADTVSAAVVEDTSDDFVDLDGLLDGSGAYRGASHVSGQVDMGRWQLTSDIFKGEAPRFAPVTQSLTASAWNALGSNGSGNGALGGVVYAVAISGTDVYVGGSWTDAPGLPPAADNLAKWNGTSWSALSADQNGPSPISFGTVHVIVPVGAAVYVGGAFFNAAGVAKADNVARFEANAWFSVGGAAGADGGISGEVDAIVVSGSDIFVGGYFFHAGYSSPPAGATPADMAAWWNGSVWLPLGFGWGPTLHYSPLNARVNALLLDGRNLYVGTQTQNINGEATIDYVGRFNLDEFVWHSLDSNGTNGSLNGQVSALALSGTKLYVGGEFTGADGVAGVNYLAKWDTGTGAWSTVGSTSPNAAVRSIAVSGANVYVGGEFTNIDPTNKGDFVARWTGSAWQALGANGVDGALNAKVQALVVTSDALYAGGNFTNAGGNAAADFIAAYGLAGGGQQKPDGRIKKGSGALAGNNIYNTTGTNQTKTGTAAVGATVTFTISIQNDGTGGGKFYVKATGSTATYYQVKYFRGTTDITAAVVAGTYQTAKIAKGSTFGIKAKVKVKTGAAKGSSVTRLVTLTSTADSAKVDAVKFTLSRS